MICGWTRRLPGKEIADEFRGWRCSLPQELWQIWLLARTIIPCAAFATVQRKKLMSETTMSPAARRISVVIPAYNAASFITDALDSIARQTLLPVQVVVVNDGSKDTTSQVIQDWIAQQNAPFSVADGLQHSAIFARDDRLGHQVEAKQNEAGQYA